MDTYHYGPNARAARAGRAERCLRVKCPLATYTGWNLRDASIGAPEEIQSMVGSFIPFARTKAEREKTGDPRLSIAERYPSKEDYLKRVEAAGKQLAQQHLLLDTDVEKIRARASARWDSLMQ